MKNFIQNINVAKILNYGFGILIGSFAFYGITLALISALAGGTEGHINLGN